MPKLKSSNSSIDSGTFDGFDDPEDHFYDEPLLPSYEYQYPDNGNYRNASSSSPLPSPSPPTTSVIESLLLKSCSNYKPFENQIEDTKPATDRPLSTTSSDSLTSTGPITIKKPKIRPPKPPRHINNNSTSKKLINQSVNQQLPLTLPPKGVRSLSTESSSTTTKRSDNTIPTTLRSSSSSPPPPLPPPSISRKPSRPPPPIPDQPSSPSNIDTDKEVLTSMAVLNRSRSSQGPFYETAFDSKTSFPNNLHRGNQINQLSQDRQSLKMTSYHHNHHSNHQFNRSTECNLSDSLNTENSSRSSTASSTTSSSSTGHDSSRSSTPKHLDNLPSSLFPRRHQLRSSVQIPRSKSNDVTLNLLAAASNSSKTSNNQIEVSTLEPRSPSVVSSHQLPGEQLNKRNNQQNTKRATLSTFSMVKSTTSDALSQFECENGYVLTRTRSNLDSLRLSIQDRNKKVKDTSSSSSTTVNDNSMGTSVKTRPNSIKFDKPPVNRSICRLNLKLDETRLSNSPTSKLQSPLTDTRPLDDYDTPWDSNQRLNKVIDKLVNTPSNEMDGQNSLNVNSSLIKSETESTIERESPKLILNPVNHENTLGTENNTKGSDDKIPSSINIAFNAIDATIGKNDGIGEQSINQMQSKQESIHSNTSIAIKDESNVIQSSSRSSSIDKTDQSVKPERPRKLSLPLNLQNDNLNSGSTQRNDLNLNLNFCNTQKESSSPTISTPSPASKPSLGSRKKLLLTFTNHPLPVVSEDIDTSLALEKQGWYHGSISRLDAETLLRHMKEGSYLIRNCESTKQDYSLSLKSAKGFMHMKIVKQHDGYILGVFSKPFTSIPEMVKHYSINKLPIRGAEHMSLLYPVIDQLL